MIMTVKRGTKEKLELRDRLKNKRKEVKATRKIRIRETILKGVISSSEAINKTQTKERTTE